MDKTAILRLANEMVTSSEKNRVTPDLALLPELVGLRLYEEPLLRVADADDPAFLALREPGVIGRMFRPPRDWLPGAKSVLSLFFPFTDEVVASNGPDPVEPSPQWLHARIEGQAFLFAVCKRLEEALRQAGHEAITPSAHPDFAFRKLAADPGDGTLPYASNWSERHVAHVAGLGTFGLSAGLITEKGIAGRFGSVVTSLAVDPDARPYSGPFDYCNRCGACIRRCVHGAISEAGKHHPPCDRFLDDSLRRHQPRYGCGKCQVQVPCSRRIPLQRKSPVSPPLPVP